MGNKISQINHNINIGFDDMKQAVDKKYTIITTIPRHETNNIIKNTVDPGCEEECINGLIDNNKLFENIIIYGRNSCDTKIYSKYNDLINFGFYNIYVYTGGMFEWMLLQDIYGFDNFPSTENDLDILKFKPISIINNSKLLK